MVDVLIIGAGQAGLGTAYWLSRSAPELSVLLVDRAKRIGQSWVDRWDSLRLFTPRRFSTLPGSEFPAGDDRCPSRLEMADYLQDYADALGFPVLLNTPVECVGQVSGGFEVTAGVHKLTAQHVVVATGPFHDPAVPAAAAKLSPEVRQVHSYDYRRPEDLPGAEVAVVGGGNSAAQLALELAEHRLVTLVSPGQPWFVPASVTGLSSYAWMSKLGILDADAGGPIARYLRRRGDAIFGRALRVPLKRGRIRLLPHRVVDAQDTTLHLEDGTRLAVSDVLWCTGFHARYDWLRVPGALDAHDQPRHTRGASPVEGLHWMGLPWQSRVASSIIYGVDADARWTAERIEAASARRPSGRALTEQ